MKIGSIVRYQSGDKRSTGLVVETSRGLLDVSEAADWVAVMVPTTMKDFIDAGELGRSALMELLKALESSAPSATPVFLDEADVEFAPVLDQPEKIIGVGLNYRLHAEEMGAEIPTRPVLFSKFSNALTGHRSEVPIPVDSENLDYEAELAIVIGRDTYCVSEADALSHVFGYTTANDVSARDLQYATSQWMLGKIGDKCAPIGPLIATADEIPNPNALAITCERNQTVVQSSNTSDMVFNCKQLVSYISRFMTLRAGDIILTGTPSGVINGQPEGQRVWLQPGDKVVTRIGGIGSLEYSVAPPRH